MMSKGGDPIDPPPRAQEHTGAREPSQQISRQLAGPPSPSGPVLAAYADSVMNTFGPPKRVFVRGEGCHVWDADGRRYLDLLSGLAANPPRHAHPTLLSAITGQLAPPGHLC